MNVAIRTERDGDRTRLVPAGPFDLPHAVTAAQVVDRVEPDLASCDAIDLDLTHIDRIDGTGAVMLATLLDRLEGRGCRTVVLEGGNPDAARLIALYRGRSVDRPAPERRPSQLARLGEWVASLPATATSAVDFIGQCSVALPKVLSSPRSVDWRSVPQLIQSIGADALLVTGAANLLVGLIVGSLGVSQLARFGAVAFVPELVVVAHFRELGPLVTAIVVAGRSGAGLASEIATMNVSEEIDALRSMGFDPMAWLVVPRCLALVLTVPVLTWIGDLLALGGGLLATTAMTDMTPRAYILGTDQAVTAAHLLGGLAKTPFLALAIGLIACGQGLAARGGAAAVGARTTTAVVLAIFGVIVISAVFTLFYTAMGI